MSRQLEDARNFFFFNSVDIKTRQGIAAGLLRGAFLSFAHGGEGLVESAKCLVNECERIWRSDRDF